MVFPARAPARWLASAAARLTFLSGVGYIAAAYTASRFLTRSRRKILQKSPSAWGLEHRDLKITTVDGVPLAAWVVEPSATKGTVALFHGMRHNREQMLERMSILAQAGYRTIAVDHRAHGESGGKRVSFGWHEARDVQAVAHWIRDHHGSQPRYALGISMGAAAICFAGPECGWRGIILEGIYADIDIAFRRRIGAYFPSWFGQLYPAIIWITSRRLKVKLAQVRPVEAAVRFSDTPALTITGEEDLLAPVSDGTAVANAITHGQFLNMPAAGHNDVCEKGGLAYRDALIHFLNSN